MAQIKGIIFDMDGVLIDSEPLHLLAYQELFGGYGIAHTEDDNKEFIGRKDLEMAQTLIERHKLPLAPLQLVKSKEQILARLIKNGLVTRPGVMRILQKAQESRLPVGVASSATLPTIELVIETLDIGRYFQTLTSGDEVANGKPAPDVFLLAAQRMAVEPGNCLVIEDSYNGICAAKAAGMNCVAVPCQATRHQDHTKADKILDNLESLNLDEWCCQASDN